MYIASARFHMTHYGVGMELGWRGVGMELGWRGLVYMYPPPHMTCILLLI